MYEGLALARISISRRSDDIWDVDPEYDPLESAAALPRLNPNEVRYAIRSVNAGTAKQLFSLELVSETIGNNVAGYRLAGGKSEKVIGLTKTKDGIEARGVDVPIGQIEINLETVKDDDAISTGYLLSLTDFANRRVTNSVMYRGFAAGTLQIVDCGSTIRAGENPDWDISISMVFSPNLTNIEVGNGIVVPSKKGHQLLDILYEVKRENTAAAGSPAVVLPLAVPVRAAVHRIKDEINFAHALRI